VIVPFGEQQFLDVFREYNDAIYPLQAGMVLLAIGAITAVYRRRQLVAPIVAALWIWSGVEYHWLHFTRLMPAAWVFGALFVTAGVIFLFDGHIFTSANVSPARGWFGGALVIYALLLYPIVGSFTGHFYPESPTFGAPCPLAIFTLGLLLMTARPLPLLAAAVPLVWSLFALSAAAGLGMLEDAALPLGAGIYLTFFFMEHVPHDREHGLLREARNALRRRANHGRV